MPDTLLFAETQYFLAIFNKTKYSDRIGLMLRNNGNHYRLSIYSNYQLSITHNQTYFFSEKKNYMRGQVTQSTGSWYTIFTTDGQIIKARTKGKLRLQNLNTTNPIAVGDWVLCEPEKTTDNWLITDIEQRTNYIIRPSPHSRRQKHIIAANIDQLLVIVTFSMPRTPTGFIDRIAVNAEMYHVPVVLVFNKQDLYDDDDQQSFEMARMVYGDCGYKVLLTSANTRYGLDELKTVMSNKNSLVSGLSGVGKTSLLNALYPTLDLPVNEISDYSGKGQHTTTFATMYQLPFGGQLIDTPGIKTFGMTDLEMDEVAHFFPDLRKYIGQCRFNNCLHRNEPDCAVRNALEQHYIAEWRYNNYLNILADIESVNYWER